MSLQILNQSKSDQSVCRNKSIFCRNQNSPNVDDNKTCNIKEKKRKLKDYIRIILKKNQQIKLQDGFGGLKFSRRLEGYTNDVQEQQHQCFSLFNSAIQNARTLRSLDISGMDIDPILAIEIGQAIQKNSSLLEINLPGCNLNSSSLQYIFSSISNNQTLQSINLYNNQGFNQDLVNDISQFVFRGKNCLKKLNLSHCNISSTAMSCFLRNLKYSKTITSLNLSMMEFTTDALTSLGIALQHFKGKYVLEQLNIGYANIRNEGLEVLAQRVSWNMRLINIKELILRRNFINQQGVQYLEAFISQIKQIQRLDLSNNQIEEFQCVKLLQRQLYEINLNSNNFYKFPQNFFINALIINLSNNNIGRSGVFQLASIIRQNPLWIELNLSNNNIKSEGFSSLIFGLRDNKQLKKLIVANNKIDGEGIFVYMINHEQVNFEYLDISFNFIRYDFIFLILNFLKNGSLKSLKSEALYSQYNLQNEEQNISDVESLVQNFTYQYDVEKVQINNDSQNQFQLSSSNLRELNFSNNREIFTPIISSLSNYYNKIEILNLSSCKPINEQDIDSLCALLRKSTFLHNLNISNLGLGYLPNLSLKKLRKAILISSLTSLSISRNQMFQAAKIFAKNETITNFRLERLDFSHNGFQAKHALYVEKILASYRKLQELDLSYNNIDFAGIIMIFKYSKENQSLKHLNLSNQKLRADDLILISQIISNQNLISLNISNNNSVKRMKTFFSLCSSKKQEILHLDHIDFDKLNFQNCVEVIQKQKKNINGVIIDYCNFRKNGYEKLSLELIKCKKLQLLSMNYNPFIYLDLDKAAYLLNETKKLKILEFTQITFTGKSFTLVAEWLQNEQNCSIETIKITDSTIKQEWFDQLCFGIAKNNTLQNLIFEKCQLGLLNFYQFGRAIASNEGLQIISLDGNNITDNLLDCQRGIIEIKKKMKLRKINLSNNPIIESQLIDFFQLIGGGSENVCINDIHLCNCNLQLLALQQRINKNLFKNELYIKNTVSLCLRNNKLNNDHCSILAQILNLSHSLEYLYLQQNEITSLGVNNIIKVILRRQNFKLLDVSQNQIDDKFIFRLKELAQQEINLQFLLIRDNCFSLNGQKYLTSILKLQELLFIDNIWSGIDDDEAEYILQQYTRIGQKFCLSNQLLPNYIKEIMIIKSNLTDKFCKSFGKYYPLLNFIEIIDISDNPYITMYGKTYLFFHLFDLSFEKHNLKAMYITNSKDYRNLYDDGVLRYFTLKFRNFLILPQNTRVYETILPSQTEISDNLLRGMFGSWILHKVNKILFYLEQIQPPIFIVSTLFIGKFRRKNKTLKLLLGLYLLVFTFLNILQYRNLISLEYENIYSCNITLILENKCDQKHLNIISNFAYSLFCFLMILFFDLSQLFFMVILRRKIKPALQIVYPLMLEKLQSKLPTKREMTLMIISVYRKFETLPERMFLSLLLQINHEQDQMRNYQILFTFFIFLRGLEQFIAAYFNYFQFIIANPRDDQANYLSLLHRNLFSMNYQVPSDILASFCPILGYQIKKSVKISSAIIIESYRMILFEIPLFILIWNFAKLIKIDEISDFVQQTPSELRIWNTFFFFKCIISIVVSVVNILTLRPSVVKQNGFNQALAIKRFYQSKADFVLPADLKIEETIRQFIQKCSKKHQSNVNSQRELDKNEIDEILDDDDDNLFKAKSISDISDSSVGFCDSPQTLCQSKNLKFKFDS